MSDNVAF